MSGFTRGGGVPGARVRARGARVEDILVTVLKKGCRSKRQPNYGVSFRVFDDNIKVIDDALESGILDFNGILYHVRGWDKHRAEAVSSRGWSSYGPAWVYAVDLVEWEETPALYVSRRRKHPVSRLDQLLEE